MAQVPTGWWWVITASSTKARSSALVRTAGPGWISLGPPVVEFGGGADLAREFKGADDEPAVVFVGEVVRIDDGGVVEVRSGDREAAALVGGSRRRGW